LFVFVVCVFASAYVCHIFLVVVSPSLARKLADRAIYILLELISFFNWIPIFLVSAGPIFTIVLPSDCVLLTYLLIYLLT